MIRTLLLLYCLSSSMLSVAQIQEIRVSVCDNSKEPLPGAHIYINEKAITATNKHGIAVIQLNTIKIGDSITASYIAAEDQTVIIDSALLTKGKYQFIMTENFRTVEAADVTVKANIKRLYRKTLPVKRYPPYQLYGVYTAHFAVDIIFDGDSEPTLWVAGRVEGVYSSTYFMELMFPQKYSSLAAHALNPNPIVLDSLFDNYPRVGFVNDIPLKITTIDDTTGLSPTLKYYLPRVLQANNIALQRVTEPKPDYKEIEQYPDIKVDYGYAGKDQLSLRTLRLNYSGYGAGTTSYIDVLADSENHFDRKILEATLNFADTINGNSYYVKAKLQEQRILEEQTQDPITEKFRLKDRPQHDYWQVPTQIESRFKATDGTEVIIKMSKIKLNSMFEDLNISFIDIHNRDTTRFYNARNGEIKWRKLKSFYYEEMEHNLMSLIKEQERLEKRQDKKEAKRKLKKRQ